MKIAFMGPPGAGKGTQAELFIQEHSFVHASPGDWFRDHLRRETELGKLAKGYMDQGDLVPDEVMQAMMLDWYEQVPKDKGILFDGFPGNVYQAEFLGQIFQKANTKLDAVVYLNVSDNVVMDRIDGRMICTSCYRTFHRRYRSPVISGCCDGCGGQLVEREHDSPEVVSLRLKTFYRLIPSLLERYVLKQKLLIVDGSLGISDVHENVRHILAQFEDGASVAADARTIQRILSERRARVGAVKPVQSHHDTLDIVLLGGPGSGKGTQAERLRDALGLVHVSTGALFREHFANQTKLGKMARSYIERGELVPDDIVEEMMWDSLSTEEAKRGIILDGYPRTLPQAQSLLAMMQELGRELTGALLIDVDDDEIVRRLSGRFTCSQCQKPFHKIFNPSKVEGKCDDCGGELYQRSDDRPETIRARLKTYHEQTKPVVDFFGKLDLLATINGYGDLDEIAQRAAKAVAELKEANESVGV